MKKLIFATLLVIIMVIGAVSVVVTQPKAEFYSTKDMTDSITDFYSVALDRQDITEGEFMLDVWPGNKIAIEGTTPEIEEYTVKGERRVEYSKDGNSINVSTIPDTDIINVSFDGSAFPDKVTSMLRILIAGEEMEVPVEFSVRVIDNRVLLDADSKTAKALMALEPNESHRYVVRVSESLVQFGSSNSSSWVYLLKPAIQHGDNILPYTYLKGLVYALEGYFVGFGPKDNIKRLVDEVFYELAYDNERYRELEKIYYAGFVALMSDEDFINVTDYKNGEGIRKEKRSEYKAEYKEYKEEYSALWDELYKEAKERAEIPQWLQQAADGNITQEAVEALVKRLTFYIQLEVLSVDGINLSN